MTDEGYLRKKGDLDAVTETLESDGYKILAAGIKRLRDQGESDCCNVKLTSAERDAGAGARNMGEALLTYLEMKQKALQSTLGKEKDARSRKRQQR